MVQESRSQPPRPDTDEARTRARLEERILDLEDDLKRLQEQHDVLENFVFGLEQEHERAQREVALAQRELGETLQRVTALKAEQDDIFTAIAQGQLVIGRDLRIHAAHSRAALRILERDELAGTSFLDVFPAALAADVAQHVELIFASPHASNAVLSRLNPIARTELPLPSGIKKWLTFDFVRIRDEARKNVQRILITFDDRTAEHRLEVELEERRRERDAKTSRAFALLVTPPRLHAELLAQGRSLVGRLADSEAGDDELRELHALKGNARSLGLDRLGVLTHELESALVAQDRSAIMEAVRAVDAELDEGAAIAAQLAELGALARERAKDHIGTLASSLRKISASDSKRRGTLADLHFNAEGEPWPAPVLAELRPGIEAAVRNAIAHGTESTERRAGGGKKPAIQIRVTLCRAPRGDALVARIEDDGRGLDREALVERAVRLGAITEERGRAMDDAEKAELAFLRGVSTSSTVDSVAGRGMGLGVLAHAVRALGGACTIEGTPGRGTSLTVIVPLFALRGPLAVPVEGGL